MPDGLTPRSVLHGAALHDVGSDPGVLIEERPYAIASIAARRGQEQALREAVRARWGADLPATPRRVEGQGLAFVWAGPGQWLAIGDTPDDWLDQTLEKALGGMASVAAQGDGRLVLRVGGVHARAALAKGLPIDLHPRAFQPGDTALTTAAHINVQIWQLDDGPTYELAVFRGYGVSFHEWLAEAAAEFGVRTRTA